MKKQDRVFEVFRKNQYKLDERPSLKAWNKLERRLDHKGRRSSKPSFSLFSIMMMAATLVGILFFASSIVDFSKQPTHQKTMVIYENAPAEKNTTLQFAQEQAFRVKYQAQLATKVEEGSPERLLVANKAVRPFLIPKRS